MVTHREKRREGWEDMVEAVGVRLWRGFVGCERWSTIREGAHWGLAWYRTLRVGCAWRPTVGPSWAGPEER
jgi:hypothetical protein